MLKKLEALFAEVIHRTENTRGKKKKRCETTESSLCIGHSNRITYSEMFPLLTESQMFLQ